VRHTLAAMGDDLAELRDRVRRLEDLEEIRQLFVDYGRFLDTGDVAAYAGLFADEGEVLLGPVGRARGPAAIEALLTKALAGRVGTTFHLVTSPVVDVQGDEATSEVMWTVVAAGEDGRPAVTSLGFHKDDLVRDRGRWRFARRRGVMGLPATFQG
jgi:uncharacterized protein (TIGR02246 family)